MITSRNLSDIINDVTSDSQSLINLFPQIISYLNSVKDHYDAFFNAIRSNIVLTSADPVQKFNTLYLLFMISCEMKDHEDFMSYLTFREDLLSSIFYIAKTDLKHENPIYNRGQNIFSKRPSEKLKNLGVNYARLCYESLIHWGQKYGTTVKGHSTYIYYYFANSLEKKAGKPEQFYFINQGLDSFSDPCNNVIEEPVKSFTRFSESDDEDDLEALKIPDNVIKINKVATTEEKRVTFWDSNQGNSASKKSNNRISAHEPKIVNTAEKQKASISNLVELETDDDDNREPPSSSVRVLNHPSIHSTTKLAVSEIQSFILNTNQVVETKSHEKTNEKSILKKFSAIVDQHLKSKGPISKYKNGTPNIQAKSGYSYSSKQDQVEAFNEKPGSDFNPRWDEPKEIAKNSQMTFMADAVTYKSTDDREKPEERMTHLMKGHNKQSSRVRNLNEDVLRIYGSIQRSADIKTNSSITINSPSASRQSLMSLRSFKNASEMSSDKPEDFSPILTNGQYDPNTPMENMSENPTPRSLLPNMQSNNGFSNNHNSLRIELLTSNQSPYNDGSYVYDVFTGTLTCINKALKVQESSHNDIDTPKSTGSDNIKSSVLPTKGPYKSNAMVLQQGQKMKKNNYDPFSASLSQEQHTLEKVKAIGTPIDWATGLKGAKNTFMKETEKAGGMKYEQKAEETNLHYQKSSFMRRELGRDLHSVNNVRGGKGYTASGINNI